jgi:hypothetical protein
VDRAGENNAACAKATSSAGVAEPMAAWAAWGEVRSGAGGGAGSVKCHRRVVGVRWPVRTTVSWKETVAVVDVKAMVQPASQS